MNTNKRKLLFKNLIKSLITHGEIKTTLAKAKKVQPIVEKLINKGKEQTVSARRLILAFLQDKKLVNKIVDELGIIFKERAGGYTRIVRLGKRKGDNAPLVKLELIEKPEKKEKEKKREKQVKSTTKKEKPKK
ncbi:MAG: 50S ribosomal protein L17 [Microgenomates group bacterium]